MSLLHRAHSAHVDREQTAATQKLNDCNAKLKVALHDIFGIDAEPVGNRYVEDGLTLVCHHDGDLHVLYKCPKCGVEYRSFQTIRTPADLHLAATEPPRTHPCRIDIHRASATLSLEQVTA